MFASPIAIGAVFSMGAIAQYVAFIFPIALKLFVVGDKFRPGKGNTKSSLSMEKAADAIIQGHGIWGDFRSLLEQSPALG